MMPRSMKRKLIRTRIRLNQTIQKILEINQKKKKLAYHPDVELAKQNIEEELKVLNRTAEQQARMIKIYEAKLEKVS